MRLFDSNLPGVYRTHSILPHTTPESFSPTRSWATSSRSYSILSQEQWHNISLSCWATSRSYRPILYAVWSSSVQTAIISPVQMLADKIAVRCVRVRACMCVFVFLFSSATDWTHNSALAFILYLYFLSFLSIYGRIRVWGQRGPGPRWNLTSSDWPQACLDYWCCIYIQWEGSLQWEGMSPPHEKTQLQKTHKKNQSNVFCQQYLPALVFSIILIVIFYTKIYFIIKQCKCL